MGHLPIALRDWPVDWFGLHGYDGRASVPGDRQVVPMLADEVPRVPLRAQQPADHDLNGRAVLIGPQRGTVGRGRGGGTATSGGRARGNGGWSSTRSTFRSRAIASIGYLADHAELALVVNELLTGRACHRMAAQPSKCRLTFIAEAV